MRQKMKLQPKVQTKVTLKTTLIYGGSAFMATAVLFGLGFFYMNLGNNERAKAASANVKTHSFSSGLWSSTETWSMNSLPESGHNIVIEPGHVISIKNEVEFNGTLDVYGILTIDGGILKMDKDSKINFHIGSSLFFNGKKDAIKIDDNRWNQQKIDKLNVPGILTATGMLSVGSPNVKLVEFAGDLNTEESIDLKWQTSYEKNNSLFTIEHSTDNQYYEALIDIPGQKENEGLFDYSYTDTAPYEGKNFYRLKQTDSSGGYEYLKVIELVAPKIKFNILSIKPSKTDQTFDIRIKSKENDVNVTLLNRKGEQVYEELIHTKRGINEYVLKDLDLPHGMYTLTFNVLEKEYKKFIFITSKSS